MSPRTAPKSGIWLPSGLCSIGRTCRQPSPWWRHQMETFSVLLAFCAGNSPVISEFSAQSPVLRSFDVFFDLRLNNRLGKQARGWWLETPSGPLWRHCNVPWLEMTPRRNNFSSTPIWLGYPQLHDDVIKWKHFPRNWPFVRKIHRSPVNFPHKGQWRGALMFSLIYVWINDWANNREAGDLRRQHGHYDVIVMWAVIKTIKPVVLGSLWWRLWSTAIS